MSNETTTTAAAALESLSAAMNDISVSIENARWATRTAEARAANAREFIEQAEASHRDMMVAIAALAEVTA